MSYSALLSYPNYFSYSDLLYSMGVDNINILSEEKQRELYLKKINEGVLPNLKMLNLPVTDRPIERSYTNGDLIYLEQAA